MIVESLQFASHLLFATGVFGISSVVCLRWWMINRHEERIAKRRMGGTGKPGVGISPYQPDPLPYQPSKQENMSIQGMSGLMGAAQQGAASLPYPYSSGYPVPFAGVPYAVLPEEKIEVAPIPGPMDAIVSARPRKMRIKE